MIISKNLGKPLFEMCWFYIKWMISLCRLCDSQRRWLIPHGTNSWGICFSTQTRDLITDNNMNIAIMLSHWLIKHRCRGDMRSRLLKRYEWSCFCILFFDVILIVCLCRFLIWWRMRSGRWVTLLLCIAADAFLSFTPRIWFGAGHG